MERLELALIKDIEYKVNSLNKMHLIGNSSHSIDEHRQFDAKCTPRLFDEEKQNQYWSRQYIYELKDRLEEINPHAANNINHAIKDRFNNGPGHLYKYDK